MNNPKPNAIKWTARHIVIVRHVVGKENNHTSGIKMPILGL